MRPRRRSWRYKALIAGLLVAASPAYAATPPTPAAVAFGGVWKLDPVLASDHQPARPGPGGLPRAWRGLGGWSKGGNSPPPLKPESLEKVKAEMARELGGRALDPRADACRYVGLVDLLTRGSMIDVYADGREVLMLVEGARALPRRIYMSNQHPPEDELTPTVVGHSIGHWDKDTLVVDTIGVVPEAYLVSADYVPQSERVHITERWRLRAPDLLVATATITDRDVLSKPWSINLQYRRQPVGTKLSDEICNRERWTRDVEY